MTKEEPGRHQQDARTLLHEALRALEDDYRFLFEGGIFTDDLVGTWIDYKRDNEIDPLLFPPSARVFFLYYDNSALCLVTAVPEDSRPDMRRQPARSLDSRPPSPVVSRFPLC